MPLEQYARPRPGRGYTLIELMLVVAIIGILGSSGAVLMTQTFRFFRHQQARIEIQRDARAAFELMSRNLRQCQASTVVIDQKTGQPPFSRIYFTRKDGRAVIYYQDGNKLYEVSGGTRSLGSNVRYLAFSHPRTDDDNLISVSMTMEKTTYNAQTKALQLSVEKIAIQND